jgi:hypothetical protein
VVVEAEAVPTSVKPSKWPKSPLCKALTIALEGAPLIRPFGSDGPIVNAVSIETARQEFYKSYPAEMQDTKRQAWNRSIKTAGENGFIGTREVDGTMMVWLARGDAR